MQTDRQQSSSSMAPLAVNSVDNKSVDRTTSLPVTVIPVREEFRCRRTWFFYHDIRAFVTSWLPTELSQVFPKVKCLRYVPVYIFWRLFMSVYTLVWLFLHIAARNEENGVRWLIFITDLAYIALTLSMLLMAVLNIWYLVLYYAFPSNIEQYIPSDDAPMTKVYSQDNIPWFVKICWFFYVIGSSLAPFVMLGYYIIVFDPSPEPDMGMMGNATNGSQPVTGGLVVRPSDIDVYTIQFHGINTVLVLLDLFVTRIPFQFMHFFYPTIMFMIPYVIFSLIYWGAGGTNPDDEGRYIYIPLDYSKATGYGWAIILIIASLPAQLLLFLLAWLRDVIYKHIRCCYSDIRRKPYREDFLSASKTKNEEAENEMSAL